MEATFKLELGWKPNNEGLYPIYVRITKDRKINRIKTSICIHKKDWNPKTKTIRASEPNYNIWNKQLADKLEKTRSKYNDLSETGATSSSEVKSAILTDSYSHSFVEYAKAKAQNLLNIGKYRNWKNYNGFCNKLNAYLESIKKGDLLFSEITIVFVEKFDSFLHTLPNSHRNHNEEEPDKLLCQGSIWSVLKVFRALINDAVEEGIMAPDKNPFIRFSFSKGHSTKAKLDWNAIEAIEGLKCPSGSLLQTTKDCYLFSFYCAGIRAGDLIQLKWHNVICNGSRLQYTMQKNNKRQDIVLVKQAQEILQHYYTENSKPTEYIFPLLSNDKPYSYATTEAEFESMPAELKIMLYSDTSSKNAMLNKNLKILAEMAGIQEKLTMHTSRHSFASIAREEGTNNNVIKNLLAHTSIQTTEKYMGEFDTNATDSALQQIFSKQATSTLNKSELLAQLSTLSEEELSAILEAVHK